jgi:hypothetical protein
MKCPLPLQELEEPCGKCSLIQSSHRHHQECSSSGFLLRRRSPAPASFLREDPRPASLRTLSRGIWVLRGSPWRSMWGWERKRPGGLWSVGRTAGGIVTQVAGGAELGLGEKVPAVIMWLLHRESAVWLRPGRLTMEQSLSSLGRVTSSGVLVASTRHVVLRMPEAPPWNGHGDGVPKCLVHLLCMEHQQKCWIAAYMSPMKRGGITLGMPLESHGGRN